MVLTSRILLLQTLTIDVKCWFGHGTAKNKCFSAKWSQNIEMFRIFPNCPNLTLNRITDFIKCKRTRTTNRGIKGGGQKTVLNCF